MTVYLGAGLLWPLNSKYTSRTWIYFSPTSIFNSALWDFPSLPMEDALDRPIQLSRCFGSRDKEGPLLGIKSLVRLNSSISHLVQSCSQPQLSLLLRMSPGQKQGKLIGGNGTHLPMLGAIVIYLSCTHGWSPRAGTPLGGASVMAWQSHRDHRFVIFPLLLS